MWHWSLGPGVLGGSSPSWHAKKVETLAGALSFCAKGTQNARPGEAGESSTAEDTCRDLNSFLLPQGRHGQAATRRES